MTRGGVKRVALSCASDALSHGLRRDFALESRVESSLSPSALAIRADDEIAAFVLHQEVECALEEFFRGQGLARCVSVGST